MTDLENAIAELHWAAEHGWHRPGGRPRDDTVNDILSSILSGEMMLTELHNARVAALIGEVSGEVAPWSLAASEDIDALTPPDAAAALDRAVRRAREVKPLVWMFWSQETLAGADAQSVFGLYQIRSQPLAGIHRLYLGTELVAEGDYTDLKPAAQADYAARITAALADLPDAPEPEAGA